jgi:hypothetical protein
MKLLKCVCLCFTFVLASEIPQEIGSIGLGFVKTGDFYVVSSFIEGAPASESGIALGDTIIKVNGSMVNNEDLEGLTHQIRGPIGSSVTLLFGGQNKQFQSTMTRASTRIIESQIGDLGWSDSIITYSHVKERLSLLGIQENEIKKVLLNGFELSEKFCQKDDLLHIILSSFTRNFDSHSIKQKMKRVEGGLIVDIELEGDYELEAFYTDGSSPNMLIQAYFPIGENFVPVDLSRFSSLNTWFVLSREGVNISKVSLWSLQ